MLKTLRLILKGTAGRAADTLASQQALTILDQHIRDGAAGLDRARRALAAAVARDATEAARLDAINTQIAGLEVRARAALAGHREDLALEAAEALAELAASKSATEEAITRFAAEAKKLRALIADGGRRLVELERGRQTAHVSAAVHRLHRAGHASLTGQASSLSEAETLLKQLRERQSEDEAAALALDQLQNAAAPGFIAEKLERAGFGPRTKTTAAAILDRLKQELPAEPPLLAN